jgi:hypothetical protein
MPGQAWCCLSLMPARFILIYLHGQAVIGKLTA